MAITGIKAFRVVAKSPEEFDRTVGFYRQILGKDEKVSFGDKDSSHQGAFFEVGEIDLVVTRESEVTPEAKINQGSSWICFKTEDPESELRAINSRGSALPNGVVDTSFGTRGFFVNDPSGLAVYVGTPWN